MTHLFEKVRADQNRALNFELVAKVTSKVEPGCS